VLAAALLVFRETLEAGLVTGIVLAATRGVAGSRRAIAMGMLAGLAGACVVAAFAGAIADAFQGAGQELFNAAVLGVAVLMLAWHVLWMSRHGRELTEHLRGVGQAVAQGIRPPSLLAVVVGMAIMREGSEIVLFLLGIAVSGQDSTARLAVGSALGLALGVVLALAIYQGLAQMSSRWLLRVTGMLIMLLAAGLSAQAAGFVQAAGFFQDMAMPVWDTSWLLPSDGLAGHAMLALTGYTDRPSALQVLVWLATFAALLLGGRLAAPARPA